MRRYTVAKHEVSALLRRGTRQIAAETARESTCEADPLDALKAKRARRLLHELTVQQRLVLWLQAEGRSYDQIQAAIASPIRGATVTFTEGRAGLPVPGLLVVAQATGYASVPGLLL
jgi:hypothetical protein